MTIEMVLFYAMAVFTFFAAWFVVTAWNLFRCAIGLVAVLIGVAGLYLLMEAEFLSAVQIAVYAGGTMVLVVFAVIMVADVTQKVHLTPKFWRRIAATLTAEALFGLLAGAALVQGFGPAPRPAPAAATAEAIGRALLSTGARGYILPFEVISLVLLAALIGAITIAIGIDEIPRRKAGQ